MRIQRDHRSPRLRGVRPLERADLANLQAKSATRRITRLRDSHHMIAYLIAGGYNLRQVAEMVGYSYSRVVTLSVDPSLVDLIAEEREKRHARLDPEVDLNFLTSSRIYRKSLRTIEDHFDSADEANELVPLPRALAVASDFADRIGIAKKSINMNVNVDFAAKLEAARRRSQRVLDAGAGVEG